MLGDAHIVVPIVAWKLGIEDGTHSVHHVSVLSRTFFNWVTSQDKVVLGKSDVKVLSASVDDGVARVVCVNDLIVSLVVGKECHAELSWLP